MFAQRTTKSFIGIVMAAALMSGFIVSLGVSAVASSLPTEPFNGCDSSGYKPSKCIAQLQIAYSEEVVRTTTDAFRTTNLVTEITSLYNTSLKDCKTYSFGFYRAADVDISDVRDQPQCLCRERGGLQRQL
jgi:hypothetical protein